MSSSQSYIEQMDLYRQSLLLQKKETEKMIDYLSGMIDIFSERKEVEQKHYDSICESLTYAEDEILKLNSLLTQ